MNYLLTIILLLSGLLRNFQSISDTEIYCKGFETAPVVPLISCNSYIQKQYIKKTDLVQHGVYVGLSNHSYKVIGFKAIYDCHSGITVDINEKTYIGNHIPGGDSFIGAIRNGDTFTLDCINVEKDGKRYIAKGVTFEIY